MPTVIQRPGEERSPLVESALAVAIVAAKAATVAFAVDAFVNADSPRLRGKAIRTRAIGYAGALLVVPVLWWLLPDRGRYPRALDLAVTVPLLLDAGGNALDLYEEAHIDDVVHVANSAIVSGVAGALFAPQVDERWQAALIGAGVSITGADRLGAHGVRRDAARGRRDGPDLRRHDGRSRGGVPRGGARRAVHAHPRAARPDRAETTRLARAARAAQRPARLRARWGAACG